MLADMEVKTSYQNEQCLSQEDQQHWLGFLDNWRIDHSAGASFDCLTKTYSFDTYEKALGFVNKVARLAEEAQHHPQIVFSWGRVEVRWWTHDLGGLHLNDFILAARTDIAALEWVRPEST